MSKKEWKTADKLMLVVQGGIGRNIMGTAVARNLRKAYPKKEIIAMCGYPDVFLKNPYIDRAYSLGQPVFVYEDYFRKGNTAVLNVEPYQHFDYIGRRKHFVECWCDMLEIPCDNIYPEINFTENESRMAKLYLEGFDKPMVLVQAEGGKVPQNPSEKEKITSQSGMYRRSLTKEATQKLTDELILKGYMVGIVCTPNQFLPSAAERVNFQLRAILALIPHVAGVIAIDSFLQHGTAVFKRKSTVIWGGTDPKILGYPSNENIVRKVCDNPMCHRPNSYLWDFEPTGFLWDCPHNDKCMDYNPTEIFKAFETIKREEENGSGKQEPGKLDNIDEERIGNEEGRPDENQGNLATGVPASVGAN